MRWFRLYNDIVDDDKIAQIDPKTFKIFVFLMSICSQNDSQNGILPDKKFLSWRMRISEKKLETALHELEGAGIVNRADGAIVLVNWHKRQFKSDNVTERVARYRNAKKSENVTLRETLNVSPQNRIEQTRTNTEKNKERPRKTFQKPSLDEIRTYIQEKKFTVNPEAFLAKYESNGWMVGKNPMKDWRATIRYWQSNSFGNGFIKTNKHNQVGLNLTPITPPTLEEKIQHKKNLIEQYEFNAKSNPDKWGKPLDELRGELKELENENI